METDNTLPVLGVSVMVCVPESCPLNVLISKRKGMSQKKDPCQKAACAIQKCLQEHNYTESKCEHMFQAMRVCCAKVISQNSICCSGFHQQQANKEPEVPSNL